MSTREVVICEPVRTPIGRYGGMFKSLTAVDLGVAALKGLLERTGIEPGAVQDVVLGHCYPSSEAPAIGRVVALDAGLPFTVPGMQVDRRCGSGLQAVIQACLQVAIGASCSPLPREASSREIESPLALVRGLLFVLCHTRREERLERDVVQVDFLGRWATVGQ